MIVRRFSFYKHAVALLRWLLAFDWLQVVLHGYKHGDVFGEHSNFGIERRTTCRKVTPASVAQHPIILLKLGRSGSTELGTAIGHLGTWKCFTNELLDEMKYHNCSDIMYFVETALDTEKVGGFSLYPTKYRSHSPRFPTSCWSQIRDVAKRKQAFVIWHTRENLVAAVASALKSTEIRESGMCKSAYHLEYCNETVRNLRISPEPEEFYRLVKQRIKENQFLRTTAEGLTTPGGPQPLHTTFEDMRSGNTLQIPSNFFDYFKQNGLPISRPASLLKYKSAKYLQAHAASTSSSADAQPRLKRVLANFHYVKEYLARVAPELLSQLTEL